MITRKHGLTIRVQSSNKKQQEAGKEHTPLRQQTCTHPPSVVFQLEIRHKKKKNTRCVTATFIMDTEEGSTCFLLSGVSPFNQKAVLQWRVWISPGDALISEGTTLPALGVSSLHATSCLLTEEPTFSDSHRKHFHSRYARMNSGHDTMSSVLSALMERSDCLLCSDTPSNEKSKGQWFSAETK